MPNRLLYLFRSKDLKLAEAIKIIVGKSPRNLSLFKLAIKHSSIANHSSEGYKESNERLEYLGDAFLGAVIAEYLFKKFPYKDEGFLTEIRSRLVNRETLNNLAIKVGISKIIEFDTSKKSSLTHKSIYGDTLEAMVGAVYLDRGFDFCRKFILGKLILPHFDIEQIVQNNYNYKSIVIEWAQKESKEVRFEIIEEKGNNHFKEFTAQVYIDEKPISIGHGFSKKKAEQNAAFKSCEVLEILD
ncbi:MAG TPA: ribonuclease III [Cytophagales bacterium]|nr:ribonuclease III [Cytophagales bacterium]